MDGERQSARGRVRHPPLRDCPEKLSREPVHVGAREAVTGQGDVYVVRLYVVGEETGTLAVGHLAASAAPARMSSMASAFVGP